MAAPVKVLVVGSVLGEIRSFSEKVTTLNTKYGPFAFVISIGDFFEEDENHPSINQLLDGTLRVPITTYIMGGQYKIPPKILEKAAQTGGELDKASVINTSQGIRIAALGGQYGPASYSSPKYAPPNHFTSQDVRKFLAHPAITAANNKQHNPNSLAALRAVSSSSTPKIDILLTHVTPASMVLHTPNTPSTYSDTVSPQLDDVVRAAVPRYHFVSGGGMFWEREPFGWPNDADEGRCTRFLSIGAFGGTIPDGQKRPRWSYAFSIAPLTPNSPSLSMPTNLTFNPYYPHHTIEQPSPMKTSPQGVKRPLMEDGAPQFRWAHDGQDGPKPKRQKKEKTQPNGLPEGYVCRICQSTEHFIKDCPERSKPPEGYVCRRCQQTGHFLRDCPTKDETGDTGGRKPPPGYNCRACGSEKHLIDDCPQVVQGRQEREQRRQKGPPKEIAATECWFCLMNPNIAKHLLVSLGDECYVSLPKGQLPITSSKDNKFTEMFPVPGGGQVIIIPISHNPTLRSLPPSEAPGTLAEVEKYKAGIRSFYASYSCGPVFFEVAKRMIHGVHAQLHVMPIPQSIPDDEVEETFHKIAKQARLELKEEELGDVTDNYMTIELPSGKTLVHIMDEGSRFPLQFPRMALASLFGLPERVDWKSCVESEQTETAQAEEFKTAFRAFDPFFS
ncbi:hypothetical protein FRC17_002060 [Serendipita sp. 399]|nr:hypothetical protein FRC17_002060 [Serendipita sp. 399]